MLKIIIPLAGPTELFANAGYFYPKPLIEIKGRTMIDLVLQNPSVIDRPHQFIFIIKEEDMIKFHLDNTLKLLSPACEIIKLKRDAKGALCSVMMAIEKIDKEDSLLIMNGDQVIDADFNEIDAFWIKSGADAGVVIFNSVHPRWSYARIENENVMQTSEKNPISKNAIAGYYYFNNAESFFDAAFNVIKNDVQLNGNFYISSTMNHLILKNKTIKAFTIPQDAYHSFYSPQMVVEYERK